MQLVVGGRLVTWHDPVVMGIVNATPDSFHAASRAATVADAVDACRRMTDEGATILDIGGQSTRPGADRVDVDEELRRVVPVIDAVRDALPEAIVSIDTFSARVARAAIEAGAHIINDVSGGDLDDAMFDTVADLGVPYILMHMQNTPDTMQDDPTYRDVVLDVARSLGERIDALRRRGVRDIIADPGFGFGKSTDHNYRLLTHLDLVKRQVRAPILAGISRKRMIQRVTGRDTAHALHGTTAAHMVALQQGADILRVHDVAPAVDAVRIFTATEAARP